MESPAFTSDFEVNRRDAAQVVRHDAAQAKRHGAIVRVTHWITTVCFFALLITGAEIVISHPRFYWGETGNVDVYKRQLRERTTAARLDDSGKDRHPT